MKTRPKNRPRPPWALGLVAFLPLSLVACGPPPADPGVQAYQRFSVAIRAGQAEEAVTMLTDGSRAHLARRLGLPEEADGKAIAEKLLVRADWRHELPMADKPALDEAMTTEDRRVVLVTEGGAEKRTVVVRVGQEWKVDLFARVAGE